MITNNLKYMEEKSVIYISGKKYTVKNLTPIYSKDEREKIKKEIEANLFEIFKKYVWKFKIQYFYLQSFMV